MKKVKSKVNLLISTCPHYSKSFTSDFKKKHPQWAHYNDAIYLNHHRISGGKDYNGTIIFSTELSGKSSISTIDILKALNIPNEIINQIEFED